MATGLGTVWEIRPATGSDTNGGGFDPNVTSPGTDYSQQDSPQVSYTDLVIGATNTQLTSVANPFSSSDVGNFIQITSGSGFTAGFYEVASVSGAIATMSSAVGTAASTGGHGYLGGALASLSPIFGGSSAVPYSGSIIWLKGTLTVTSAIQLSKGTTGNYVRIVLEGYSSSRGDNGKATITTATNSVNIIKLTGSGIEIRNIAFTTTAGTTAAAVIGSSSAGSQYGEQITIRDCSFSGGFTVGVDNYAGGYAPSFQMIECTVTGCTSYGVSIGGPQFILIGCYIYGNGSHGVVTQQYGSVILINTICASNTGCGVYDDGTNVNNRWCILKQCVLYNNGSDGVKIAQSVGEPLISINTIYYNNSGYGINGLSVVSVSPAPMSILVQLNNAFGSNTSGARNSVVPSDSTDITLTANPFNNAGSGDFTLNSTSGGGASCSGAGWQSSVI